MSQARQSKFIASYSVYYQTANIKILTIVIINKQQRVTLIINALTKTLNYSNIKIL